MRPFFGRGPAPASADRIARRAPEPPRSSAEPLAPPPPPRCRTGRGPPIAALSEFSGRGSNPLVQAASPLLLLMGRLRTSLSHPDVGGLRRQALDQIREFEERARAAGVAPETALAARYVLCSAIDEAVLATPWGNQSEWSEQTLLITLHREAWGGEKFFDMLERICRDPSRHIDLMELQYLCLALGFAGKYQVLDRGHAAPRRGAGGPLSPDPQPFAACPRRSCRCIGAAWRIGAIR